MICIRGCQGYFPSTIVKYAVEATDAAPGPHLKQTHAEVGYESPSRHPGQNCAGCSHSRGTYDAPRCTRVQSPIWAQDWCRGYDRHEDNSNGGGDNPETTMADESRLDRICKALERLVSKFTGGGESGREYEEYESEDGEDVVNSANMRGEDDELETSESQEAQYERAGRSDRSRPNQFNRPVIPVTSGGGEGNINPVSARDALSDLRKLRMVIEESGDRRAIDAYNSAVSAVKQEIRGGGDGDGMHPVGRRGSRFTCDARVGRLRGIDRRAEEASSFEAMAARHFRRNQDEVEAPHREDFDSDPHLRAQDELDLSLTGRANSFVDSATRMRDELLSKKPSR